MRLLIGRALAALATALIPTTLTLAVLRATGSGADLGLVLAAEMLPLLVFLPVGGVLADRLPPERVALVADLTRCLAQAGIGVELLLGVTRILDLAVLSAVSGIAIAFGSPAVPRLVALVVPEADRLRVNSRIGVATSLSSVLAPGLAGGIALLAGPGWAALLTGVLYACSALTLGGIRTARPEGPRPATGFVTELRDGWLEVRRRPWFLGSLLGHGVWHFMAGLFLTLAPMTAVRYLGGEAGWVLIVQAGTVGLVAGVFAAPRLPIRRPIVAVQVEHALRAADAGPRRDRAGVGDRGRLHAGDGRPRTAQPAVGDRRGQGTARGVAGPGARVRPAHLVRVAPVRAGGRRAAGRFHGRGRPDGRGRAPAGRGQPRADRHESRQKHEKRQPYGKPRRAPPAVPG